MHTPNPEPTDQDLIDAANRGDADAFQSLYLRYRDWCLSLAYRFTGSRDDALDVVHDAFIYLLGKFPSFTLTARMTTFLYPVVRNTALAHKRKRRRFVGPEDALIEFHADPGAQTGPSSERLPALLKAVRALQPGNQEVLLMRVVDGMSVQEVAEALNIPQGTVKSRLHNALATLRQDATLARQFPEWADQGHP